MEAYFPMLIVEVDVQTISCSRFMMPKQDIGRGDIEITIDYGDSLTDTKTLTCNIWARIGNAAIKGFLTTIHAEKAKSPDDDIDSIMSALNSSEEFYNTLHQFIAFMTQEK